MPVQPHGLDSLARALLRVALLRAGDRVGGRCPCAFGVQSAVLVSWMRTVTLSGNTDWPPLWVEPHVAPGGCEGV